jgi:hypothetical protein
MSKRAYFLISSFFLTGVFFFLSKISFQWKYAGIIGFSVGVMIYQSLLFYTMSVKKENLLVSTILPGFFSLTAGLFRFLFAVNWVWQIILLIVYFFGIYTLFLIENVFLVSIEVKTVPLYRAASTVGFLITLITAFFAYEIIFSFRLAGWQNALLVFVINFLLLLHFFWKTNLGKIFCVDNLVSSSIFSLILGEIALAISLWPLETTKSALYLTSVSYVFLGLAQAHCQEKLFKETIREFILVGLGTFLALFFVTSWR